MQSIKILVVDDEADLELLVRHRFRQQIRQKEYEFVFAHDGQAALDLLRNDPAIEVVLTDINMPGMDGLTLLARIRESNRFLHPVIVSAYGDLANIRTAMNRGAIDFLIKPIDFNDFEITLVKTIQHSRAGREAAQARDQLVLVQRELSIAANIQQSFLPAAAALTRPEIGLHATMLPAWSVGGDFYDFFPIDEKRLGLVVGDVSGKGVSAALYMTVSRTVLRAIALRGTAPGECLEEVNRSLCRDNRSDLFVTAYYAVLDLGTGELLSANAGHPPALRVDRQGLVTALPPPGSMPLGFFPEADYETTRTVLQPGDVFVLYTDGVTEARNREHDFFGDERLQAYLGQAAGKAAEVVVRGVVEAVQTFTEGAPQADDLTVLAGQYRENSIAAAPPVS